METQKITIHRALAELKLIDSKIDKTTNSLVAVGLYQKDKLVNGMVSQEDFQKNAQSNYDSVVDLINRKSKIKSAIVKANGEATLKIGDKTMTIADAITAKASLLFKKNLIAVLKQGLQSVTANVNKNNQIVEQNLQRLLEAALGKDSTKIDSKDIEAISIPYQTANEFHLYDPIGVSKKIEVLEKEVSEFEMEVDSALSEINAVTFIEI